jgi:ribonuclease R
MKPHKSKSNKLDPARLKSEIAKFMLKNPGKLYTARQILNKIKLKNSKPAVHEALLRLTEEKLLIGLKEDRFKLADNVKSHHKAPQKEFTGYVDMTKTGAAYIICENLVEDVYVPAKYLNGAMNKDYVKIQLLQITNRRRPEAEVVEVITRSSTQFIGTLKQHGKQFYVDPDGMYNDFTIYIKHEDIQDGIVGDKVVVRILTWPGNKRKSAEGEVVQILGKSGQSDIEMKTILINQGFELEFPDDVLAELKQISDKIQIHDIESRLDMRSVMTITIDPEDAKDFDDALSFRELEDGHVEIGIHIADVSHYVKPGTALDKDAFKRSTSVYLVDRVLPMLPEKLSNELCSLRPKEDKLTFSVIVTMDSSYKIVKTWIGRTIIHSDHRYSYEDAQKVMDAGEGPHADMLLKMNKIAVQYREQRFKDGAIGFESDEIRFRLDEEGVPIEVFIKERKETHLLIEEFMLMANKATAEFMAKRDGNKEVPFIYRIHDLPDMDKLRNFAAYAREMGYHKIKMQTPKEIAHSLNELTKAARTDEQFKLLEPLAIRTMAKAEYSPNNIGHYGLGFEHYSHFTSPIRRYSDVIAHRIIFENLDTITRFKKEELEFQCRHISLQERKAMDAERESTKYKQVEYMERFIGQVFEGRVSGMIDKGLFVELTANKCEGLIPFSNLSEPFYIEENRLKAKGMVSGREIKIGELLSVRVIDTNLERREIEFDLADD